MFFFHHSNILVLAAITASIAAVRRSTGGSPPPASKELLRRIEELVKEGIYFKEGMSGCTIMQREPLDAMAFSFLVHPKDDKPFGSITRTSLIDFATGKEYTFDKSKQRFYGKVEDVKLERGIYTDYYWNELAKAGLLPLEHLSQETRLILKYYASESHSYGIHTEGCYEIVNAIVNDPPPGYSGKGWILDFYRDKAAEMRNKLIEFININKKSEK